LVITTARISRGLYANPKRRDQLWIPTVVLVAEDGFMIGTRNGLAF
jgi:hypothetical protein